MDRTPRRRLQVGNHRDSTPHVARRRAIHVAAMRRQCALQFSIFCLTVILACTLRSGGGRLGIDHRHQHRRLLCTTSRRTQAIKAGQCALAIEILPGLRCGKSEILAIPLIELTRIGEHGNIAFDHAVLHPHALDFGLDGIRHLVEWAGWDTRFVDALPTAMVKPFSGSAARAMLIETMQTSGVDSFPALVAATVQGSTETTFYVLAVYFGAVGIQRARHAVGCALLAELAGVLAAIGVCYWFFG